MPPVEQFIERMGRLFQRDGMARIAGRIFGRLMLWDGAMSLDELAEVLQVSKTSVSTNARLLERSGMIERLTFPGDRRDYYQVSEVVHQRMLELRLERLERTRELLQEGLGTEAAANPTIRERLELYGDFFDRMIRTMAEARDAMAKRSGG